MKLRKLKKLRQERNGHHYIVCMGRVANSNDYYVFRYIKGWRKYE